MLYFTGVFLNFDMGVIRQGIAIAFGLFSIKYILERSFKKFIITILLGALFHVSILVFIPLYVLSYKQLSRKLIYITTFSTLVISILMCGDLLVKIINLVPAGMIKEKLLFYAALYTGGGTISIIKRILFLVFFVEFYKRKQIDDKKSLIFLNGYFLSIIVMALFSSIDIIGGRGSIGLYFLQIFIFPTIMKNINTKIFRVILLGVLILMSIYTMKGIIDYGGISNQPYIPYRSILSVF
ncbi:MAG TPA: hypothetical protein DHW61_12790 [Lachnoclostridium phytofermentans]|uniref:EpsG family protein n=2 Tax=Lachnoclostridium TaxID=1506553 RepID=A0A3D2X9I9_9FIRM|nr:hypothetical protein [Lachnoclostridium phytofermentans]